MNVNTLNCNNNVADSVVLPPQMNNILLWYDSSQHKEVTSGNITKLYDRSGNGHTMAQTTVAQQPANTALSGKFGGRRVTYFDSLEDRFGSGDDSQLAGTVDLTDCFGEASSLNDDPSWTIAYVDALASDTQKGSILKFEATAGSAIIGVNEDGAGVGDGISLQVVSDSVTDVDECGGNFIAADTPRVNIVSSNHTGAETSSLQVMSNGSALTWDDSGTTTNTLEFGVFTNINKLTLGVNDGSSYPCLFYLAEFILFKAAMTTSLRTEINNYLNDKWQVY